MARLNLKDVSGERESGRWISELAAKFAYGGMDEISTGSPRTIGSAPAFEDLYVEPLVFDTSIDASDDQLSRANSAALADGAVYVQFHFDRTVRIDDTASYRVVNVVIPDFTNKLMRDANGDVIVDDGVPVYDLTGVAEELFGYTTRACCE